MIILIPIIYFLLIKLTIRKAGDTPNITKHVLIRILILPILIGVSFLGIYLMGSRSDLIGAFYLSVYILGAWLVYLIVETIALYAVKMRSIASANFIIVLITLFISVLVAIQMA